MRKYYTVCIRWNDNDSEEGTFTESTHADSEDQAIRLIAESMSQSSSAEIDQDDEDEVRAFVSSAIDRVEYCDLVNASIPDDLRNVFFDELFPDGNLRQLDMKGLAKLLAENRERVLR